MKGQIRGMGKNASVAEGPCRITLTSEDEYSEKFLRAVFNQLFNGWDAEEDAVLIEMYAPMFERAGWTKPAVEEANP